MRVLLISAGVLALAIVVFVASRPSRPPVGREPVAPKPASLQAAREYFGQANWDLDADPATVPAHQRTDPSTGRKIPITRAQLNASTSAPASPLDEEKIESGAVSTAPRVTVGEPAEGEAEEVR